MAMIASAARLLEQYQKAPVERLAWRAAGPAAAFKPRESDWGTVSQKLKDAGGPAIGEAAIEPLAAYIRMV
jgi:hypothetical protein